MKKDKLNIIYKELEQEVIKSGRSSEELVLGDGPVTASIVLIGEAPGREETEQHKPFVGKAGKILNSFLENTGLSRDDLFITNAVKFRPYKISAKGTKSNRPPTSEEIGLCSKCLEQELKILQPRLIVTLGNTPLKAVLCDKKATVGEKHGHPVSSKFGTVFPLYHPASLIYNRSLEPIYYADIRLLKDFII